MQLKFNHKNCTYCFASWTPLLIPTWVGYGILFMTKKINRVSREIQFCFVFYVSFATVAALRLRPQRIIYLGIILSKGISALKTCLVTELDCPFKNLALHLRLTI